MDEYLEELVRTNQERLEALAVDGIGLDPLEQLMARMDLMKRTLIGAVAALSGKDPVELDDRFETSWEEECAERILKLEGSRNEGKLIGLGDEQLTIGDFVRRPTVNE